MAKFPEPPGVESLQAIPAETQRLAAGTLVARIFFATGTHATTWDAFRHYGPTASRFDHHLPDAAGNPCLQERGIMYLACGDHAIPTCLAEVFQTARTIDRHSHFPVLAGFELQDSLLLLNLRGTFATTIGASMNIHSGPKPKARRWSQQIHEAWPEVDGILYSSSMYGGEPAIALFERGLRAIPRQPNFHRELRDPVMTSVLASTAQQIDYVLV